jgi:EpsI family protein
MFYVGSFWRDADVDSSGVTDGASSTMPSPNKHSLAPGFGYTLAIILIIVWPVSAMTINNTQLPEDVYEIKSLEIPGWSMGGGELTEWKADYQAFDTVFNSTFQQDSRKLAVLIGTYIRQRTGAELINSENRLVSEENSAWKSVGSKSVNVVSSNQTYEFIASTIMSPRHKYRVAYIYFVDGDYVNNKLDAKLKETKSKLFHGGSMGSVVMLILPQEDEIEIVDRQLTKVIEIAMPVIDAELLKMVNSIE